MKLEYALDYSDFLEHQLYISSKSELHKKNRNRSRIIVPIIYIGLSLFLSFINEIANLCEKAKVDIKDVSLGMGSDERIGDRFLRAGPAYGGSCFPKDTRALIDIGRKFNTNLVFS